MLFYGIWRNYNPTPAAPAQPPAEVIQQVADSLQPPAEVILDPQPAAIIRQQAVEAIQQQVMNVVERVTNDVERQAVEAAQLRIETIIPDIINFVRQYSAEHAAGVAPDIAWIARLRHLSTSQRIDEIAQEIANASSRCASLDSATRHQFNHFREFIAKVLELQAPKVVEQQAANSIQGLTADLQQQLADATLHIDAAARQQIVAVINQQIRDAATRITKVTQQAVDTTLQQRLRADIRPVIDDIFQQQLADAAQQLGAHVSPELLTNVVTEQLCSTMMRYYFLNFSPQSKTDYRIRNLVEAALEQRLDIVVEQVTWAIFQVAEPAIETAPDVVVAVDAAAGAGDSGLPG